MENNMPKFIENIDWNLLREQKELLINVQDKIIIENEKNAIEGILFLIDAMQDYAVDEMGLTEVEVFGELLNEE